MASTAPTFAVKHLRHYEQETQGRWRHRASTVTAVFLVLISAIVISSASLCLTISGIDPFIQVILPGILPGFGGLLISAPLIVYSRHRSLRINDIRKRHWLPDINTFLKEHPNDFKEKEAGAVFIENKILLRGSKEKGLASEDTNYKKRLLRDLIDQFYPNKKKTEDETQLAIYTAISTAKDRVGETDRAREKRLEREKKAEKAEKSEMSEGKEEEEEDAATKT